MPRLTYREGVPELTTPSRPHEAIKSMIGRLVEAYVTIDRSALLPGLDLALLQRFIDVKPMTRTEYRAALRESR